MLTFILYRRGRPKLSPERRVYLASLRKVVNTIAIGWVHSLLLETRIW